MNKWVSELAELNGERLFLEPGAESGGIFCGAVKE